MWSLFFALLFAEFLVTITFAGEPSSAWVIRVAGIATWIALFIATAMSIRNCVGS